MKILFDTSVFAINQTGVGNYVVELLASLKKRSGVSISQLAYQPFFSRKSKLRGIDSIIRELFWYDLVLAKRARTAGIDLIHCPAFNFPVYGSTKVLVTIHDIYAIVRPEHLNFWHRKTGRYFIKQAVKSGRHILIPTEFTKNEILRYFPQASSAKLHVIHSGISPDRFRQTDLVLFKEVTDLYKIQKPYFLSLSTIEPRKNFDNLLRAFALIANKVEHNLIVVGQSGWKNRSTYRLIAELKLETRVLFTGFVPDEYLNVLYSNASCFVFPSYYEGFGFTPLEAMQCGCPVASSNTSCMPEVLGEAAAYFDPANIDSIATALLRLSGCEKTRTWYSNAGLIQASKYNWDKTATLTVELYQQIINN